MCGPTATESVETDMTGAERLRYRMLGPLVVENDDGQIELGGPKQRAVLAMLLINASRPVTPDQLVDALWADEAPSTALGTLQSYISNLRRALEPHRQPRTPSRVLVTNGAGYQLEADPAQIDACRFEALLREATPLVATQPDRARRLLVEALSLWHGPALAEFTYDDFAIGEIARLDELRIAAVEFRIATDLALGAGAEVIAELEELVVAHPLRERLWQHLMLALYRSSRHADALRAYRRFAALCAEIGITPSDETQALELAILNREANLSREATMASQPSRGVQLVGRTTERARWRTAIERARSGHGSILVVEGEPGIGKTRLLETFHADAGDAGCLVALARCVEVGGTPPFWPWVQVARQIGRDRMRTAAGPLATFLGPLFPHDAPETELRGHALFHVAAAVASTFEAIAATQPLVVLIDDVYSADPDSLSLLGILAAEIEHSPVVLAISHRGGAGNTALTATLAELARLSWVERILVPRLDEAEVVQLVDRTIGGDVDPAVEAAILERAEGNPFFTIELAKLVASHANPHAAASAVPPSIFEVVSRRLEHLAQPTMDLIRAAAVSGRSFDFTIVREAADLDLSTALAAIDEARLAGLVSESTPAGRYRFTHVIVVDSVTSALGSLRRAQLHDRIAAAIEQKADGDPDRWVEIAHHRVNAVPVAGTPAAIEALAKGGKQAIASNAFQLARRLLQQRLDLVLEQRPGPKRDEQEMASLADLAVVWTWLEGYNSPNLAAAADRLWELTGIAQGNVTFDESQPVGPNDPVLAAIQARFSVDIVSGDLAAAEDITQRLLSLCEAHPDPMVVYAANQSAVTVWTHSGRIADSIPALARSAAALDALDPARSNAIMLPLGQQPARITHHMFGGRAHWLAGDEVAASEQFTSGRALCDRSVSPFATAFAMTAEGYVAAIAGDPDWVEEVHDWGRRIAAATELFGPIEQWRILQSTWANGIRSDAPHRAAAEMRCALATLAEQRAMIATTGYWALVAELELRAGSPADALDATAQGIAHALASGELFWHGELERLAAIALESLGRHEDAARALAAAKQSAGSLGVVPILERLAAVPSPA